MLGNGTLQTIKSKDFVIKCYFFDFEPIMRSWSLKFAIDEIFNLLCFLGNIFLSNANPGGLFRH